MILTIDIGNTNTDFAVFNKKKKRLGFKLPTKQIIVSGWDLGSLKRILEKKIIYSRLLKSVIICSVVPKATRVLKKALQSLGKAKVLIVGKDLEVPIKNLYKNPKQVGQDRLVAAFGASKIYGAPVIVVDFGTATTLDVVSNQKEYLGGIIIPGIGMSLDALHQKTALLPKVSLQKPKRMVGKTTEESISSGICYGFASLVDGLIDKISQELKQKFQVVFTGGLAKMMGGYSKRVGIINSDLILQSLQLICLQKVT